MPSPIQTVINSYTGVFQHLTTAITPTQPGSCLVVYSSTFGDDASPTRVAVLSATDWDGASGTFVPDHWATGTNWTSIGASGINVGIRADPDAAAGTNAVQVGANGTGTQTTLVVVEEWPGLALTFADLAGQAAPPLRQSSNSSRWSVGPTTGTRQPSELVLGAAASFNGSTAGFQLGTPGLPWTEVTQPLAVSGYYQRLAAGHFTSASAGPYTYHGTTGGGCTTTALCVTLHFAPVMSGAADLSGVGELTGAGVFGGIIEGDPIWTGVGVLTAAGAMTGSGAANLSGEGSLTGAPTGMFLQAGELSGLGTLAGMWAATLVEPPVDLSGEGSLSASKTMLYDPVLYGSGTLWVLQATGGLVFASPGVNNSQAYPCSSQVAVAPPGSGNWQYLGTVGHVTGLVYSFVCPGGADKMTCTVMVPADCRPQMFSPGWKVRITRGGHQVWSGRLDEPVPSPSGWTLTAVGTGNRGQDFLAIYSSTWPASQPDQSISNAIARGLPWVNPGVGSPAGAWFGQAIDSGGQTVTGLLNLICTRGALTWMVNSQPGGLVGDDLAVFPLPTVPNRLLTCTTPVGRTLGGDINTIFIRYEVSADTTSTGSDSSTSTPAVYATTSVQNAASVAAHGVIETYIDLSDVGVQSQAAAQAVGNKVLAIYQRASFAGPFTAHYGQLMNSGGTPIDPGTDQAGTMVRLLLTDYGYGGEVAPGGPVQFIVGTYSWDDVAMVATITPYVTLDESLTGLLSMTNTVMTPIAAASTAG